jgi:hypothetical protein
LFYRNSKTRSVCFIETAKQGVFVLQQQQNKEYMFYSNSKTRSVCFTETAKQGVFVLQKQQNKEYLFYRDSKTSLCCKRESLDVLFSSCGPFKREAGAAPAVQVPLHQYAA